jgi:hypothetical protein
MKTLALLRICIDFVLKRYVQAGVDELDTDKLPACPAGAKISGGFRCGGQAGQHRLNPQLVH